MMRNIAARLLVAVFALGIGAGLGGCVVAPYHPGGHHWGQSGHHHQHHHRGHRGHDRRW